MRKRFLLFLFLTVAFFAAATGSLPNTGWVPLYHLSDSNQPKVSTSAARDAHMTVQVTLPGFDLSTIKHNHQNYHRITLPEQCSNLNLGTPNVPMLREIISVPEGSVLRINVIDVKYRTYRGINLEPAQRSLDEGESEADREFRKDETVYSANEFFPANWVGSSEMGKHREVNLNTLEMHPIRYNPVTGELQAAYSITYTVEFVGYSRYSVSDIPEHLENTYKGMLLNYDYMNYRLRSEDEVSRAAQAATDYLVIASSNLVNSPSLKQLVQYHEGQGRVVEVRDVKTMGKNADEIKKVIKQIYAQASPAELDYILLVGDTDTVPLQQWAWYDYRSDVWYGYLEGNDKIADVGVGRFPARNETELANMVRKTLAFHTNANPGPWQKRGLLVAHAEQYPRKYTECKESIFTHNFRLSAPQFLQVYGGDKAKNWTNADLIKEINKGALVINYRGHGQRDHWHPWNRGKEKFTNKDVYSLKNGGKTPVIFNIACYNGDIEHSPESLIEAMIRHPNGGAVAALGALNLSKTTVNHDFDRALFFGTWDKGINSIGDLLNYGIAEILKKHGMTKNVVIYLWVGDPALSLLGTNSGPAKMRLSTNVVGKGTISLNPAGGAYDKGTVVTATAKADKGWKFSGWSGDAVGTTATAKVTMSSYKSITANFIQTELPVPTGLKAKAEGSYNVSLSWNAVEGADSYVVYQSGSAAGVYTEVATAKVTTATVANLKADTTYYFKIKAQNGALVSAFSAQASAKTAVYKPNAPVVTISSPANNSEIFTQTTTNIKVVAKVTDIDGDLKSVILGTEKAVVAGDLYTFTISNVAPGTYTYKVEATDAGGLKGSASVTVKVSLDTGCKLPKWVKGQIYEKDNVCHNGRHWYAKWYTKTEPGTTGQWGPWEDKGKCGSGGTNPTNLAPELKISSPFNNSIFKTPADIQIVATATDKDGKVVKVEVFQGDKLLGKATAGSNDRYTYDVKNLTVGTYTFKAKVTDDKGATFVDYVTVKVEETGINPGNAWAPNVSYKVGDTVTYKGLSYKCTSAHTSLRGWEPANVPALWRKL